MPDTRRRKGGRDAQEEARQEEAEAREEAPDVRLIVGEFAGIRYEADPSIPRGEIVFLANKLGAIVRGRVLKGSLTLTFPPGPGVK